MTRLESYTHTCTHTHTHTHTHRQCIYIYIYTHTLWSNTFMEVLSQEVTNCDTTPI